MAEVHQISDYTNSRSINTQLHTFGDLGSTRITTFGGGGGSGSGDGGGNLEVWQTGVERQISEIRTDIGNIREDHTGEKKWVLAALAAGFVFVLGAGATSYVKLSDHLVLLEVAQSTTSGDIRALDARVAGKMDLMMEKISKK